MRDLSFRLFICLINPEIKHLCSVWSVWILILSSCRSFPDRSFNHISSSFRILTFWNLRRLPFFSLCISGRMRTDISFFFLYMFRPIRSDLIKNFSSQVNAFFNIIWFKTLCSSKWYVDLTIFFFGFNRWLSHFSIRVFSFSTVCH